MMILIQDDARPGWYFTDNIFLNAQHSRGALIFVHPGLPSSLIPAFCN